jgi:hypothetical protein
MGFVDDDAIPICVEEKAFPPKGRTTLSDVVPVVGFPFASLGLVRREERCHDHIVGRQNNVVLENILDRFGFLPTPAGVMDVYSQRRIRLGSNLIIPLSQ